MDPIREALLDAELNSAEQVRIANIVRSLPQDEMSLAWRSDLNSKLAASAAPPKPSLARLVWRPVAGLAIASVLTFAIVVSRPQSSEIAVRTELESAIGGAHVVAQTNAELIGFGVEPLPSQAVGQTASFDREVDLGAF